MAPNLWGQEIDLLAQMDQYWGRVQNYLHALFAWQGMDSLVAEETAVLPGMEELASLMQITALADSGKYDVIVIDCAPTGSTLQLLSFPEMARWYIEKIFPFQRKTIEIARPVVKRFSDMPIPDAELFDSVKELVGYLERISQLLSNADISSMRLVLNPEKMVIKEAQRAYTYLNLYGYAVDAVICNRVFPAHLADSYFDQWKSAQADNLQLVHECFHPLPVLQAPFFPQEVTGRAMLAQMADAVFGPNPQRGGAGDPTQHFYLGKPQAIIRNNGQYVLSIPLPLVVREEVNLHRSVFDELVVRIGNWKRNISLPIGLARLDIAAARYEGDFLNVYFASEKDKPVAEDELKPARWQTLKTRFGGK
jgi:arsenite-transporting ATPase